MQVIANRSITVDGVKLRKGYNECSEKDINVLKASAFVDKGLYEFVDINLPSMEDLPLEKLTYNQLKQKAKKLGINSLGMKKDELKAEINRVENG